MLEGLIIERLQDKLGDNVTVLNAAPSTSGEISAALHPAVHVFEKQTQIVSQVARAKQCTLLTLEKEVWIVLVIKDSYDTAYATGAVLGIDDFRKEIMGILAGWNPDTMPFITVLEWTTDPFEVYYEADGIIQLVMAIKPKETYSEKHEYQ
ncbi:MAG: hypothetical protein KAI17_18890 [Thiotrichaceae bacterium]|nr:hypothetical protein [Thiotrichaceae bacterium]